MTSIKILLMVALRKRLCFSGVSIKQSLINGKTGIDIIWCTVCKVDITVLKHWRETT